MRIVGGEFRGRKLATVGDGDSAVHLRPTTDRVRENIFNVLSSGKYGDPIKDKRVLDLFAGSGALGLEALSRGAAHITFVDDGKKAKLLIRKNIELLKLQDRSHFLNQSALQLGQNPGGPYDLIFADPPYGKDMATSAVQSALEGGWINEDAIFVLEENTAVAVPDGLTLLDRRRYGDTHLTFLLKGTNI